MAEIGIGRLAEITGVKVPTIRFYEQSALVPSPRRTDGRQRRYDERAVARLRFIRRARELGFSVDEIRQLLGLVDHPATPCVAVEEVARHHLREVEEKIAQLKRIRFELKRMIEACDGGSVSHCRILEIIGYPKTANQKCSRQAR
jgi:DNA-binding transcriptional MerR regulator